MKTRTRKQTETAKLRAENFVRNVLEDDDEADEIADETVDEYADRKGFVIKNSEHSGIAAGRARRLRALSTGTVVRFGMNTKAELEGRVTELEDLVHQIFEIADSAGNSKAEMQFALQQVVDLADGFAPEEGETEDEEEEEEEE